MIYKLRNWVDINKIDWYYLSRNPNAIHFLEQNLDKIKWYYLSENPPIFKLDYERLEKRVNRKNNAFINNYTVYKSSRFKR